MPLRLLAGGPALRSSGGSAAAAPGKRPRRAAAPAPRRLLHDAGAPQLLELRGCGAGGAGGAGGRGRLCWPSQPGGAVHAPVAGAPHVPPPRQQHTMRSSEPWSVQVLFLTACPVMAATGCLADDINSGRTPSGLPSSQGVPNGLRRQPWRAHLTWRRCRRTRDCCAPPSCWPSCATSRCALPAAAPISSGADVAEPQLLWHWQQTAAGLLLYMRRA